MAKKDKKKEGSSGGTDLAIAVLTALAGGIAAFLVVLIAGAIISPESFKTQAAQAEPIVSHRGTLPTQRPAQGPMQTQNPEETDAPVETVPATQTQEPSNPPSEPTEAPPNTKPPEQTNPPAPTKAPAEQNPGPVVSANPTTPPARQTQAPAQSGNSGTIQNSDGTYKHDFSGGRVLATTQSNNRGDPVYHTKDCRAAKIIPPENERWYQSAQAAKDDNRRLCGYCAR